jgi:hypothetical protein
MREEVEMESKKNNLPKKDRVSGISKVDFEKALKVTVHHFSQKLAQLTAGLVANVGAWKSQLVQDVASGTLASPSSSGVSPSWKPWSAI